MPKPLLAAIAVLFSLTLASPPALAWGDEGHKIVALIAQRFLTPEAAARVAALLAADTDDLAAHDIASAATWADKYRDQGRRAGGGEHYLATRAWHFVDLELDGPDLAAACYGQLQLPPGQPASAGPADSCIVDKINQFAAELADPATPSPERILALKFLLHLVGDIHQPLHASDNRDAGGNRLRVTAPGHRAGSLHHYWDTELVRDLGPSPAAIAADLAANITSWDLDAWQQASTAGWAMESFAVARDYAYGGLPVHSGTAVQLDSNYLAQSRTIVARQLSRAGVRLGVLLSRALSTGRGTRPER